MKESKRVMFDKSLSVLVKFEGKELDLTDFCQKHPGGAAIIKQYKGKSIDDVVFNPKMHKHNPAIRKKLLSYVTAQKQPSKPSLTKKQTDEQKQKENSQQLKPLKLEEKLKEQPEENYSVEEREGSVSEIPIFETQFLNAKWMGLALNNGKLKKNSWSTC